MVGNLEKLAKYESENLVLNKSTFNISELIEHILKNYEADFTMKCIKVSFTGDEEWVTADKDKISQVLINLISNALKYGKQYGTVEISVNGFITQTRITVKDTGIGIASDDLPHIFERFYRADKSRNRITGGSGIGLAIVKAIIEAHNGSVNVISKLNVGTEFVVILPKETS